MSRGRSGVGLQQARHVEAVERVARAGRGQTAVVRALPGDPAAKVAVPSSDEATMNAKTETVRNEVNWSADGTAGERHRAPVGALGFAALGLWVLAVVLGIGAPLFGVDIDSRRVVAVLVASGVVSLLSLPITASMTRTTTKDDGRTGRRPD